MVKHRLILPALAILPLVAAAANLPRKSPELAINLQDGKQVLLSQYKGKVVAVCFILTTCPHCQMTIGFLTKAQKDFGPRGLQVLASAIEEGAPMHLAGFIQQFNTTFPVGSNDPMTAVEWMQHPLMLIPHMPLLAFVDRQGNIRAQFEGDDEKFFNDQQEQNLRNQIEALLKEGAPAKKTTATKGGAPKKQS
ncbi:MAG: TlpA family protein disulfide reductase [Acidobacteriia bacterium]|nr:TlpA family protein disulfide reductase [Terriglobia bacterium]